MRMLINSVSMRGVVVIGEGEFEYGGMLYTGVHEPLVNRDVWERCQEVLDGRQEKKNRKVKHDFSFSSLVKCGHCGCSLVGELKKERYVYYHCTGYRGKCPEPYTREEVLVNHFSGQFRNMIFPAAVLDWLQEELAASDIAEQGLRAEDLRRCQSELDRLARRLNVLYDDRLDGRIDAAIYDEKAEEIRKEQERIRTKVREARLAGSGCASEVVNLRSLASQLPELFESQCPSEQRRLLRLVLGEAVWQNQTLRAQLREPFGSCPTSM